MLRSGGLAILLGLSLALAMGLAAAASEREIVRPYDLYDPRFCHLTPRPFICERCLKADQQFVQRLRFDPEDGRPIRSYGCRPYAQRYLN